MIFYVLFFIIFIFFCFINDFFVKKTIFKIGLLALLCAALAIILGIKGRNVGSDTAAYMSIYEKAINGEGLGHVSSDYGYALICNVFAKLHMPYLAFSMFVAFLEVFGVFLLCLTFSKYSGVFFSSFFAISQLQMLFSAQRQSIACSFVFIAVSLLYLLKNKNRFLKYVVYYVLCLLAFSFHKASIAAFVFPLLLLVKFNIRHTLAFSLSILILCLFSSQISQLFTHLNLTSYSNINTNTIQVYSLFGLVLSVFLYFIYSSEPLLIGDNNLISFKSIKAHSKQLIKANCFLNGNVERIITCDSKVAFSTKFIIFGMIGSIFMSFSSFSGTLTRFAFFCFPLLFVCLSNVVVFFEKREKSIVYISTIFFFFALYIWLFIYKDPLHCVPYYVEI